MGVFVVVYYHILGIFTIKGGGRCHLGTLQDLSWEELEPFSVQPDDLVPGPRKLSQN